ncbi:hypothetical protein THASP1DRAFT_32956 [Thamnocephalis sphaerospora]|uniref:RAD51 interacting motif domain-containing protein n=1 Tax=Thamnocephalis sphaerospora TaxID=78915 RepID=A0A4P9XHM9_9FUNG|nr:hypothetical protein THASP1DRAFT_32956 [Thamnocephalis sphaerospora]|eukprot:RKP05205.1 hypothetical protein THASP1DRAFT_32956 [Thamnocephalis sphaerospora]
MDSDSDFEDFAAAPLPAPPASRGKSRRPQRTASIQKTPVDHDETEDIRRAISLSLSDSQSAAAESGGAANKESVAMAPATVAETVMAPVQSDAPQPAQPSCAPVKVAVPNCTPSASDPVLASNHSAPAQSTEAMVTVEVKASKAKRGRQASASKQANAIALDEDASEKDQSEWAQVLQVVEEADAAAGHGTGRRRSGRAKATAAAPAFDLEAYLAEVEDETPTKSTKQKGSSSDNVAADMDMDADHDHTSTADEQASDAESMQATGKSTRGRGRGRGRGGTTARGRKAAVPVKRATDHSPGAEKKTAKSNAGRVETAAKVSDVDGESNEEVADMSSDSDIEMSVDVMGASSEESDFEEEPAPKRGRKAAPVTTPVKAGRGRGRAAVPLPSTPKQSTPAAAGRSGLTHSKPDAETSHSTLGLGASTLSGVGSAKSPGLRRSAAVGSSSSTSSSLASSLSGPRTPIRVGLSRRKNVKPLHAYLNA